MTYGEDGKYDAAYTYGIERIGVEDIDETRPESQDPLYYLYDGLGSVTYMVKPDGNTRDHYVFDEYGKPAPGNTKQSEDGRINLNNTFGYTGEQWDEETNLLYLRSRYYEPETGRFLSRDSYEGELKNPLTKHLYVYAGNSPVNRVDPSGHYWVPSKTNKINKSIDRRPIVFMHGRGGDQNTFKYLVDQIKGYQGSYDAGVLVIDEDGNISPSSTFKIASKSGGRPLIRVEFKDSYAHVATQTLWFKTAMERILSDSGYYQVDVVAHSMGGLTALSYIQSYACPGGVATNHVRNLLSLSTPYGGSKSSWLGLRHADEDLRPGSDALKRLSQGRFPDDLRILAWSAELDAYVSEESAKEVFQWVKNSEYPSKVKVETATIPEAGHVSIHEMEIVSRLIKGKLFY